MKIILKILLALIVIGISIGFYFRNTGDIVTGDRFIGVSILASAFILLPLFLYFSWKGKKLEDYTLSDKNIKKMKERNKDRR